MGILEEHDTVRTGVHQQVDEMYHDIAECFVEESASSTIAPRDSRQYSTDHCARVTQSGASVPSSAHQCQKHYNGNATDKLVHSIQGISRQPRQRYNTTSCRAPLRIQKSLLPPDQ
jgi:hypothetical protein